MNSVLVLGGAHIDRRGRIAGSFAPAASNPGSWREEAGGGAFNAARNLARLGHDVRLISARGGDANGALVAAAAEACGVEDRPITYLDRTTPTYTAILDAEGDLVVALADMALYDLFSARQLSRRSIRDAVAASGAILADANLPEATLAALAGRLPDPCLFGAIAISPAKIVRLLPVLSRLSVLFMNTREAESLVGHGPEALAGWPDLLRALGLRSGVVTRGPDPAIAFDVSGAWSVTPPAAQSVVDVTGAGDAIAAATFSAMSEGLPIGEALRHGVAAAMLTVRTADAVAADLDKNALQAALRLVPPATPLQ